MGSVRSVLAARHGGDGTLKLWGINRTAVWQRHWRRLAEKLFLKGPTTARTGGYSTDGFGQIMVLLLGC